MIVTLVSNTDQIDEKKKGFRKANNELKELKLPIRKYTFYSNFGASPIDESF